jgi:hypothetical protein
MKNNKNDDLITTTVAIGTATAFIGGGFLCLACPLVGAAVVTTWLGAVIFGGKSKPKSTRTDEYGKPIEY